jgi:large subunit ribosomal protein L14e
MIEIGRVCVKTAGRDARAKCLVVDVIDKNYVLIDGQTRRRKCNIVHLEPLDKILQIGKNAGHDEVVKALKELNIECVERKTKAKTARPKKQRKGKAKVEAAKPTRKKPARKAKKAEK